MNTETNKFGFKMSKNRLIFGVVLLAIVSVALIMVVISLSQDKATFQQDVDVKAQKIPALSQDKATLQQDVDVKAQKIADLSQDKATLQQDVDVKAQNITDLSQDVSSDDC